jgi:hypothetical protein
MEGCVAKTALVTAGFLLSAVLALSAHAAPDCKAAPGGCPSPRAVKSIAPPKPGTPPQAAAKPKPRLEPVPAKANPKAAAPKATKQAASKPAQGNRLVRQAARPSRYHGGLAQGSNAYRYDSQPALRMHGPGAKPPSGPVYEADRRPTPLPGYGCDEACRYRAWFQQYNAWYQAYGRRYAARPDMPETPMVPAIPPFGARDDHRSGQARNQSERDRLDPWHGYNSNDGPQNGY